MENKIYLNLSAPNKLTKFTVLEATKMKQKSSMTDSVHRNGAPVKKVKRWQLPISLECVYCHEILLVKAFHLKFKARLLWNTTVLEFFTVEFNCVGNHFSEEFFSEIS